MKEITIFCSDKRTVVVPVLPSSVYHYELMTREYIKLYFNSRELLDLHVGDYIMYNGRQFKIKEVALPARHASGGYSYEQEFCAAWEFWANRKFIYGRSFANRNVTYEAGWAITDFPSNILLMIVRTLVREFGLADIKIAIQGATDKNPSGDFSVMKYCNFSEGVNIIEALNIMCNDDHWQTEWWFDEETFTLHFGSCELGEEGNEIELKDFITDIDDYESDDYKYGAQIKSITRQEAQNANKANRLYVFGSTRNIPYYYKKSLVFEVQDAEALTKAQALATSKGYKYGIVDNVRQLEDEHFLSSVRRSAIVKRAYLNEKDLGDTGLVFSPYPFNFRYYYSETIFRTGDYEDGLYIFKIKKGSLNFNITSQPGVWQNKVFFRPSKLKIEVVTDKSVNQYRDDEIRCTVIDLPNVYPLKGVNPVTDFFGQTVYMGLKADFEDINETQEFKVQMRGNDAVKLRLSVDFEFSLGTGDGLYADAWLSDTNVEVISPRQSIITNIEINGKEVQAVLNAGNKISGIERYSWVFDAPDMEISVGDKFIVEGVSHKDVNPSWFTRRNNSGAMELGITDPRLLLPEGTPYIDVKPGLSREEIIEGILKLENIYPRVDATANVAKAGETEETIKNGDIVTFNDYELVSEAFRNFDDSFIINKDEGLHVIFQDGSLKGMRFEVVLTDVTSMAAKFGIIRNDDYGERLPNNDSKRPENGVAFILEGFDTTFFSQGAIEQAEQELLEKGREVADQLSKDVSTYTCEMNQVRCLSDNIDMNVGQRVLMNSKIFGEYQSRIRAVEKRLDNLGQTYTIGASAAYSKLRSLQQQINNIK